MTTQETRQSPQNQPQNQMKEAMIDVRNEAIVQTANLYLMARKTLLATLGAAALTVEQANAIVDKLAERGEVVATDLQKWIAELEGHTDAPAPSRTASNEMPTGVGQTMSMAGKALEESMEVILSRLNVPTKSDIEMLNRKVTRLNEKVNALLTQQEQTKK